jgi:hypothetical protein
MMFTTLRGGAHTRQEEVAVLSHRHYPLEQPRSIQCATTRGVVDRAGPWSEGEEGDAVNHEAAQATFRSCTPVAGVELLDPRGPRMRGGHYRASRVGRLSGTASSVLIARCWPLPSRRGRPWCPVPEPASGTPDPSPHSSAEGSNQALICAQALESSPKQARVPWWPWPGPSSQLDVLSDCGTDCIIQALVPESEPKCGTCACRAR